MTRIAILPERRENGDTGYRAIAGERQGVGKTAGEALDALTATLPDGESGTLVIVQTCRPDAFFTAKQRERLGELMARWRVARDAGQSLSEAEQSELKALVDAEIRAAGAHAVAIANELEQ